MMTPKEIMLELLKEDGQPDRQLDQYEALYMALGDPINTYLRGNRVRGTTSKDRWGTTILFPEDAPGPMPDTTGDRKVLKDITHWRDFAKAPDLKANCSDGWEEFAEESRKQCGPDRLLAGFMGTGIFEQCHFLMGFEDTLANLYEHPAEMHELIDYITDYRITYVEMLIDGLHPDVIFSHDDWGTKDALFMKPEMWREFFKEPYRRFYGTIRDRGVIAIHHADSYLAPIVDDMVEIGIQVWQGTLPENDIPALQEHLQGKLVLMGGIGAAIDRADSTEEEIRKYVRGVLEEDCPGGHFIPCITYGLAGTVYPHVDPIIDDEIAKYNAEPHVPKQPLPKVPHRVRASAPQEEGTKETAGEGAGTLSSLAEALRRGRKKKVASLCEQALSEGTEAAEILSGGLMKGMAELGDDFSAGRAFVPEMLMAARCMTAAMDVLKPHLTGTAQKASGKVALGTMQGDLHDIGKNLVKIMMEGSGLTVIDLGVDVSPEKFIDTAIDEDCDIVACSSLLTTSMAGMEEVVKLADSRGIRDRIKIMIGGAPVTQDYCDAIHADVYTDDAAEAARAAAAMLSA